MYKVLLLAASAAGFAGKSALPSMARTSGKAMSMVDETVIGVQAPAGFYDPLGWCETQPENFARRRAVERKHGRVAMAGITGVIVHNAGIEFPGYLSKSADLKFSDVPDGFKGFFSIPAAGLAQIFAFVGIVELAWWPANNYSGDYGCGFFGVNYEEEEKTKKLNAEMANGRLAMLGVAGAMFAEGQTGQTLAEQMATGHMSIV